MIDAYTITTDMIMIFSRILTHNDEWLYTIMGASHQLLLLVL